MNVRRIRLLVLLVACIILDQATKVAAESWLAHRPAKHFLGGLLTLQYAENPGAFLSLGAQLTPALRTALFVVVSGAFLLFLAVQALRDRMAGNTRAISITLIVAGGIGNVIDRVTLGVVRDFAIIGTSWLRTGVFNVADLAITTGVVMLALEVWLRRRRTKQSRAIDDTPSVTRSVGENG